MSSSDRFYFPRRQRAGIIVLVFIIAVGVLSRRIVKSLEQPALQSPVPAKSILLRRQEDPQFPVEKNLESSPDKRMGTKPAPFDPNTATEEQLVAAGLPLRTAKILINYRNSGGKFRKKEDLLKIYTLKREDYNRIEQYIKIAPADPQDKKNAFPRSLQPVDLNRADSAELILLKGIGPVYARRILGYRKRLGGFARIEQLTEVYGFPDSTYQQLKSRLEVHPDDVQKININTAGEEELARHPYIRKYLAADIVKLRNDLKKFSSIEELRLLPLINEEKYRKIAPYLRVE